jgi:hypothetical protein
MLKQTQITVYENEMHFIQCLKPESALESNDTRLVQLVVERLAGIWASLREIVIVLGLSSLLTQCCQQGVVMLWVSY